MGQGGPVILSDKVKKLLAQKVNENLGLNFSEVSSTGHGKVSPLTKRSPMRKRAEEETNGPILEVINATTYSSVDLYDDKDDVTEMLKSSNNYFLPQTAVGQSIENLLMPQSV